MNQLVNTVEHIYDAWHAPADMRPLLKLTRPEVSGPQVAQEYADWTRARLRPAEDSAAVPVLIGAYNEQDDLPRCLLSLARSDKPVAPIVIDNGSRDHTAQLAVDMGATVWECSRRGKSNAIKMGLGRVATADRDTLLFTDADSLVPPAWSRAMTAYKKSRVMEHGGFVTGGVVVYDRDMPRFQSVKTSIMAARDMQLIRQGFSRTYGASMALFAGDSQLIKRVADSYDERYVVGDDTQIGELAADLSVYVYALGRETRVYTRGDRVADWHTFWQHLVNRELYRNLYPDWERQAEVTEPLRYVPTTKRPLRAESIPADI